MDFEARLASSNDYSESKQFRSFLVFRSFDSGLDPDSGRLTLRHPGRWKDMVLAQMPPRARWRASWVFWIAPLSLILGACGPPEGIPIIVDLAFDEDGEVVALEEVGPRGDEGPLTSVGSIDELCLDDGVCIRLEAQTRITESSDNWATSEVAWSIDPDAVWLPHNFSFHLDGEQPEVGVFDIVELSDGTVAVAAGHLRMLERSTDGIWSPSAEEMRSSVFHHASLLLLAVSALLSFGFAHGLRVNRHQAGYVAFALLSFSMIVTGIARYNGTYGWEISALLTIPFGFVGFVLLVGLLLDVVRSVRWKPRVYLLAAGAAVVLIAGVDIPNRLWYSNVFFSWLQVSVIPFVLFAGLLVWLPTALRAAHSPVTPSTGEEEDALPARW